MRILSSFSFTLLSSSGAVFALSAVLAAAPAGAAGPAAASAPACAKGTPAAQCGQVVSPVFILAPSTPGGQAPSIARESAAPVAPASALAEPVAELPYESMFDRSPVMRALAWYCGAMAPVALFLLTGFTIWEYRRRRQGKD